MGFGLVLVLAYTALVAVHPGAREWATRGGGPTPFDSLNQLLALPAQLIGERQDLVVRNDANAGGREHRIAADTMGTEGSAGKPLTDLSGSPSAAPGISPAHAAAATGGENADNQVSRETLPALAEGNPTDVASLAAADAPSIAGEALPRSGPNELKLPGGIMVANRSVAGAPAASAAFMYWAASLTVSGVTSGSPARFLMNGRLVREGDEANQQLGIIFERVDAPAKLIYFRDKSGAVVTRSY